VAAGVAGREPVDDERALVGEDLVAGTGGVGDRVHQQRGGAVADRDLLGGQTLVRGDRLAQRHLLVVGVEVGAREHLRRGRDRRG
jgi:hypothetical protein